MLVFEGVFTDFQLRQLSSKRNPKEGKGCKGGNTRNIYFLLSFFKSFFGGLVVGTESQINY